MDSRFNIPAPPTFKFEGRVCGEGLALIVPVAQADVEASAKADPLKHAPRKTQRNTKAPVPETDTGGWA